MNEGPLNTAILFVDLVSSTEFASVMGLREYAEYADGFQRFCREQCRYFFTDRQPEKYRQDGSHFHCEAVGDELVVFLHSGRGPNDVYQLICLAVALKCGWLGQDHNRERLRNGLAPTDLAIGIHHGPVWAREREGRIDRVGFAINLAKRTETLSRTGGRWRVFLTDAAYRQVNRRIRNILIGPRQVEKMKGIVQPVGCYEVFESFIEPTSRMVPSQIPSFLEGARTAIETGIGDWWAHSCLQVWSEMQHSGVTDEAFHWCHDTYMADPQNAVAMYYLAIGYRERGDLQSSGLLCETLTGRWPDFADGWLEWARTCKAGGESGKARRYLAKARFLGVSEEEEKIE